MKNDEVNNPKHYTSGNIEALDIIEDTTKDLNGLEAFAIGSAFKYLIRFDKKGNPIQDLQKAIFYIEKVIFERQKQSKEEK